METILVHLLTTLQLRIQETLELKSVWNKSTSSVPLLIHVGVSFRQVAALNLFPVIFMFSATFMMQSSSFLSHLNLSILVTSTIGMILLSLQRLSRCFLSHLVTPCIIRMAIESAAVIPLSSLFVNVQQIIMPVYIIINLCQQIPQIVCWWYTRVPKLELVCDTISLLMTDV